MEICPFAGATIAGVSLEPLSKLIWPFIIMRVAVLLLFSYVPGVSMIVPRIFQYKSEIASFGPMPSKRKDKENEFTR